MVFGRKSRADKAPAVESNINDYLEDHGANEAEVAPTTTTSPNPNLSKKPSKSWFKRQKHVNDNATNDNRTDDNAANDETVNVITSTYEKLPLHTLEHHRNTQAKILLDTAPSQKLSVESCKTWVLEAERYLAWTDSPEVALSFSSLEYREAIETTVLLLKSLEDDASRESSSGRRDGGYFGGDLEEADEGGEERELGVDEGDDLVFRDV